MRRAGEIETEIASQDNTPQDNTSQDKASQGDEPKTRSPDFWAPYYQLDGDPPWQIAAPCPPIFDLLDREPDKLPPGSVIVVGCGRGLEASALDARGFQVTAIDLCGDAIAQARARDSEQIDFRVTDLFDFSGAIGKDQLIKDHCDRDLIGRFDYLFEQTCFCAIDPRDRDRYVEAATCLLRPGGYLLGVFYQVDNEGGPPFRTDPDEVLRRFSPSFDILSFEPARGSVEERAGHEFLAWFRKKA